MTIFLHRRTATKTRRREASIRWMQAVSGLTFGGFALGHLLNIGAAAISREAYDSFQREFRVFYQYPLLEFGVLFPSLIVHSITSYLDMKHRKKSILYPKQGHSQHNF
jgi:hypothetical protein